MPRWLAPAAILLLILAQLLYAPREPMRRAVEAFGLTDVRIGRYTLLGCGKDDIFRRTFHAHDRAGRPVSGTVCGGLIKGYAVRVD